VHAVKISPIFYKFIHEMHNNKHTKSDESVHKTKKCHTNENNNKQNVNLVECVKIICIVYHYFSRPLYQVNKEIEALVLHYHCYRQ